MLKLRLLPKVSIRIFKIVRYESKRLQCFLAISNRLHSGFSGATILPQSRLDSVRRAVQPASPTLTSLCAETGIKSSTF